MASRFRSVTWTRWTRAAAAAAVAIALSAGAFLVPAAVSASAAGGSQDAGLSQPDALPPIFAVRSADAVDYHLAWLGDDAFGGRKATTTSCRFVARLAGSGTALRVEFGDPMRGSGYTVREAAIALVNAPDTVQVPTGASHPLTFGGQPGVTVGPHRTVLSDPVTVNVPSGQLVAVSVTASAGDAPTKAAMTEPAICSAHAVADVGTAPAAAFGTVTQLRWVTGIQVDGPAARLVVGLGDSITETAGTLLGGYQRWTDVLERSGVAVINAGVSGGALSRPGMYGTDDGITRLRALLAEPNVTDVVIELGTNDLTLGATDGQFMKALSHAISMVRTKGDRVYVATLMPRNSQAEPFTREQDRQWINAFLRSHWLTDQGAKLVDLDAALRDPEHPEQLRRNVDSGDGLHPNIAGEALIARTVAKAMGLH